MQKRKKRMVYLGESVMIHDFKERLNYSEEASTESFWLAIYKKAFPNFVNFMPCPADSQSQRMGIDRVILLANGKVIRIDEKKREKNYSDILLEFESNSVSRAVGWMEKDLFIDYLAYAFMESKTVYLFPWDLLRRTWIHYRTSWLKEYRIVSAKNKNYITSSVAIPIGVLQNAIKTAAVIKLV